MDSTPQPSQSASTPVPPPKGHSHWEKEKDIDQASAESFPASDAPAYNMGIEPPPPETGPQVSEQAPHGAHPPEAPEIDSVVAKAFREVEPHGFRDNPESAMEAADFEVQDTIGGE